MSVASKPRSTPSTASRCAAKTSSVEAFGPKACAKRKRFDAKLTKSTLAGDPIYPRWIFYYYCTHLRWVADPNFCIDITGQMDIKEQAILAYESQFVLPEKNRHVVEWLRQFNGYMGSRIGTLYAEPFFTKEPIGLSDFASLVM